MLQMRAASDYPYWLLITGRRSGALGSLYLFSSGSLDMGPVVSPKISKRVKALVRCSEFDWVRRGYKVYHKISLVTTHLPLVVLNFLTLTPLRALAAFRT